MRREIYVIAAKVPFTGAPRSHGNAAARERAKEARRRPLRNPGSRLKKPTRWATLASGVSLPVGRDTPSRGSRPLAVPDRQPGLNACGAAVLMPDRSIALALDDLFFVVGAQAYPPYNHYDLCVYDGCAALTHPTITFAHYVGWVSAAHPPFDAITYPDAAAVARWR